MADLVIPACVEDFRRQKAWAERAIAQLDDAQLHVRINPLQNSIAAIVKHMAGNMRSRWVDFLTSDGEKPGRDRESEFVDDLPTRAALLERWEQGWAALFAALEALTDADLGRTVRIRGEPLTAFAAIIRQTSHYAQHVGQILLIAKHLKGEAWQYITIPPGGSEAFNRQKGVQPR
jgi:hypothetical protein